MRTSSADVVFFIIRVVRDQRKWMGGDPGQQRTPVSVGLRRSDADDPLHRALTSLCMRRLHCYLSLCVLGVVLLVWEQDWPHHVFPDDDGPIVPISARHCVVPFVIRKLSNDTNRITLVLHASSDKLDQSLAEQVENWNGPVSLAVAWRPDTNFNSLACATQQLRRLKRGNDKVDEFLSVHFLVQDAVERCEQVRKTQFSECQRDFRHHAAGVSEAEAAAHILAYPINEARNLGRQFADTAFILVADLHHLFSFGFERKMLQLANRLLVPQPKTALVYRIFEITENATSPRTKTDLRTMMKAGEAFVFHHHIPAHNIERLEEWLETPEREQVEVQFVKPYDSAKWEPQFVSFHSIPNFDPKFRYPQRDNTVLRWEMCRAGYAFAIVTDVFMYHRGFKSYAENNFLNRVRQKLLSTSTFAVEAFNARMDTMYPETKRTCPKFSVRIRRTV